MFIEDAGSLTGAIALALQIGDPEYDSMVEQAKARNRERSWKATGTAVASLYQELLK